MIVSTQLVTPKEYLRPFIATCTFIEIKLLKRFCMILICPVFYFSLRNYHCTRNTPKSWWSQGMLIPVFVAGNDCNPYLLVMMRDLQNLVMMDIVGG